MQSFTIPIYVKFVETRYFVVFIQFRFYIGLYQLKNYEIAVFTPGFRVKRGHKDPQDPLKVNFRKADTCEFYTEQLFCNIGTIWILSGTISPENP